MSVIIGPVECGTCKRVLDELSDLLPEHRAPCPTCGSLTRAYNVEVAEKVTLKSKLGLKHRRPGFRKPIYEEVGGDDLHRKTGVWSKLLRIIDRQNNRYVERITNVESGEIIRAVNEPLTEHTGRGSAKDRPRENERDA